MGYTTFVHILNDAMDAVVNNPEEFVQGIRQNYFNGGNIPLGNHANPARVLKTHHADQLQLVTSFHNLPLSMDSYDDRMRDLIERRPQVVNDLIGLSEHRLESLKRYFDAARVRPY